VISTKEAAMKKLFTLMLGATVVAGCVDRTPTDVSSSRSAVAGLDAAAGSGPGITVMTYNVYYGTDAEPLLAVTNPDDIPFVAAGIWALEDTTNFPERAGALAAEIAKQRPHLVGLQEAALWRIQSPSDFGATPATDVVYDFLALLVDSLAAHGQSYVVAAANATTDIELPVFVGLDGSTPLFDDVRLTDRDAVLVRGDVAWSNAQSDKFDKYIDLLGSGVYEGWASVDATIDGRTYRFVSAHLEFQEAEPIQVLQAQELIDLLEDETRPTILVGDFNSDASGLNPAKETASYGMLTDAGFVDSWNRSGYSTAGLTCCQDKDLLNPFGTFGERVDIIFTRNMPLQTPAGTLLSSRQLVGDRPGDRTISGLWPSDHAGVVATFLVPPVAPTTVAAMK
jgi:hypothetical protein